MAISPVLGACVVRPIWVRSWLEVVASLHLLVHHILHIALHVYLVVSFGIGGRELHILTRLPLPAAQEEEDQGDDEEEGSNDNDGNDVEGEGGG